MLISQNYYKYKLPFDLIALYMAFLLNKTISDEFLLNPE